MKEKAIKAGILLAVGLFVCVLVSRMVIYMTAPKAQFISFEQTYIFNEYTHKGMLEYVTYQNMFFKDAMKRPLQITDIHVKQGDSVEKGDILFTFQLFQDVQSEKKQPLTYKAPVKGRVTIVNARIGDMYNGTTPLYAITTNEFPVITIPKTEVSLDDSYISNDYTIKYNDKIYECKVKNIEDGKLVLVPSSAFFDADTLENLLGNSFTVQSITQKVVYETALPISAVHRKLNKDYIYIVKKQKGFWEDEYRVEEMEVEILKHNDFFAAVSAHLEEGSIILDKWDRTMSAGQRVYEFAE